MEATAESICSSPHEIRKKGMAMFVSIENLFNSVKLLMEEEIKGHAIEFRSQVDPANLQFMVDEQLIEQVLINLLRNSMHALKGRKNAEIRLVAFFNKRGRFTIQVGDNATLFSLANSDAAFIAFASCEARETNSSPYFNNSSSVQWANASNASGPCSRTS